MAWILRLHELGAFGWVYRVPRALGRIGRVRSGTVDVETALVESEEPAQHVIERAVLHHQNDDVIDLLQIVCGCVRPFHPYGLGRLTPA
jgi:hypothetical protein